jgi:hypothetical protein
MSFVAGVEKDEKKPEVTPRLAHLKYKYAVQVELF